MSTTTTNYGLIKPSVNDPTDADLWGTEINSNMDTIDTTMKSISTVADNALAASTGAQLPVGSLYFNASVATNPATLLGYGTWTAFGQGVVLLGVGTGTDINSQTLTVVAGQTGGEYKHALSTSEMPSHAHIDGHGMIQSGGFTSRYGSSDTGISGSQLALSGADTFGSSTSTTGGSAAANITQPYIGVYIWLRAS